MRTVGTLMGACLFAALFAPPVSGQQLGIYLSASWDSSTGDTYAYAQTASDYATGYWYYLCVDLTAFGQEPGELSASDYYDGPFGCDSTDAEVDWSFTTYATTNYLDVFSDHQEYIEYQTYQQDPYCGFDYLDCYSYWDDFRIRAWSGQEIRPSTARSFGIFRARRRSRTGRKCSIRCFSSNLARPASIRRENIATTLA